MCKTIWVSSGVKAALAVMSSCYRNHFEDVHFNLESLLIKFYDVSPSIFWSNFVCFESYNFSWKFHLYYISTYLRSWSMSGHETGPTLSVISLELARQMNHFVRTIWQSWSCWGRALLHTLWNIHLLCRFCWRSK